MDTAAVLRVLVDVNGVGKANSQLMGLDGTMGKVAKTAVKFGGALAVGSVIKSTIGVAASFEKQMSNLGAVTNATGRQMQKLKKQALDAGAATAFSAREAAAAQTELAKGGLSVAQIMKGGLKGALSLAAAGEMELADAASTTANALNLFGLNARKAGHVADALSSAALSTTADVADFAMALTQGGAAAKTAGLSFNQTVLALEALAAAGVKNSDAGTSLKAAITQLGNPTVKAQAVMDKLGLSFFKASGGMKDIASISSLLRGKLGGLTKQQQLQAASTLAGTDGMRALLAIMDAGPAKLDKYEQALRKQGTAAGIAAKNQDNLAGKWEQFTGALETLGIIVGSTLLPVLSAITVKATELVNSLTAGGGAVAGLGSKFQSAGAQIGAAFQSAFAYVKQVIDENRASIDSIGKSVADMTASVKLALGQLGAAFKSVFGSGSGAGKDMREIMSVALKVGAVLTQVFVGTAGRAMSAFVQQIKGLMLTVRGVMRVITGILTLDFDKALSGLKDIARGQFERVIAVIRGVTAPAREVASRVGSAALNALKGAWSKIQQVAASLWGKLPVGIRSVITKVGEAVMALAKIAINVLKSFVKSFFEIGKQLIQGLINGIKSMGEKVAGVASDIANGAVDALGSVFQIGSPSKVAHKIGVWVGEGLANGIRSMAGKVGDAAGDVARAAVDGIKDGLSNDLLFPLEAKIRALEAKRDRLTAKWAAQDARAERAGLVGDVSSARAGSMGSVAGSAGKVRRVTGGSGPPVVAGGKYLQGMGLQVAESKYFGGVTTNRHAHYKNDHYSGNSIDVNYASGGAAELSKLQVALAKLKAKFGGLVNAFIEDAGTANQHLHATFQAAFGTAAKTARAARKVTGGKVSSGGKYNRVYAAHPTGTSGAALSPAEVMALAMQAGFSKQDARQVVRIAKGESNFMPGIYNSKDNGMGLLQMTPIAGGWGPEAKAHLAKLGGIDAMRNPLKNLQMAKWLHDRSGFSPWNLTWYGNSGLYGNLEPANIGNVRSGGGKNGVQDAIGALQRFDKETRRNRILASIDAKIAGLEKLKTFRDTIKDIRSQLDDKLNAAVDKFRENWEKGKGLAFDKETERLIANTPAAIELAALKGQDLAEQMAEEDRRNQQALTDAQLSGDPAAIADAQRQIAATARARRETQLEQEVADETERIQQERADKRQEELDADAKAFEDNERKKLKSLVDALRDQEITYAQFVGKVKGMLAEIGQTFEPTADQEAAVLGMTGMAVAAAGAIGKLAGMVKGGGGSRNTVTGAGQAGGTAGGIAAAVAGAAKVGGMLPSFDGGGTVPGPRGAPVPILAHGGETVLTPEQGGGMSFTYLHNGDIITTTGWDEDRVARDFAWRIQSETGLTA